MRRFIFPLAFLGLLIGAIFPAHSKADDSSRRLFFLHHSTGRLLLDEGHARQYLNEVNNARGSDLVLWDHDYNYIGLSDVQGDLLGYDYSIPGDDTYPAGLHELWTTNNSARDSILARYDIVAFKSCYPACDIDSEAQLQQYQQWYLEMRTFFDSRPDKTFIIMSPPPRHRLATNATHAERARRFARWLTSDEYLSDHPNLVGFDFFDLLANPDDGSATSNMLRYQYELSHSSSDSHPNALANSTNAPIFIDVLVAASQAPTSSTRNHPSAVLMHRNYPNPFNPNTVIFFEIPKPDWVQVQVINLKGQRVQSLLNDQLDEGPHSIHWDGRDALGNPVSSGQYFYQVKTSNSSVTGKMILAR